MSANPNSGQLCSVEDVMAEIAPQSSRGVMQASATGAAAPAAPEGPLEDLSVALIEQLVKYLFTKFHFTKKS